jgi:hypothetical protein
LTANGWFSLSQAGYRRRKFPISSALLTSESPAHGIVLDLEQVKLVDRDAVLFLALSEALGASLRNCSAYIRKWINQERNARRGDSESPKKSEG